jgi:putative phosphoribosyl transferase
VFVDRADAGRQLGQRLQHLRGTDVVVLGLPRGGVRVAAEVAAALDAPLDVIVVRKLGVPTQPVRIVMPETVRRAKVTPEAFDAVESRERAELARRAERFRGDRPRIPLSGRTVIVVDDGIATGSTARAACQVARAQGAARVVLAVPVAPANWTESLSDVADEMIALTTPRQLQAIGMWYSDFSQSSDDEVLACLRSAIRS